MVEGQATIYLKNAGFVLMLQGCFKSYFQFLVSCVQMIVVQTNLQKPRLLYICSGESNMDVGSNQKDPPGLFV